MGADVVVLSSQNGAWLDAVILVGRSLADIDAGNFR
jgi:hypothetical protein